MATISLWQPRQKEKAGYWRPIIQVEKPLEFARLVGAAGTPGDAETATMDRLCRAISREFNRPAMLAMDGRETVIDEICCAA
jgi:hypothetical protein